MRIQEIFRDPVGAGLLAGAIAGAMFWASELFEYSIVTVLTLFYLGNFFLLAGYGFALRDTELLLRAIIGSLVVCVLTFLFGIVLGLLAAVFGLAYWFSDDRAFQILNLITTSLWGFFIPLALMKRVLKFNKIRWGACLAGLAAVTPTLLGQLIHIVFMKDSQVPPEILALSFLLDVMGMSLLGAVPLAYLKMRASPPPPNGNETLNPAPAPIPTEEQ